MEIVKLSQEQIAMLNRPLPAEAVTPHPSKKFLSSIKSIYVTERLNEVFGVGQWNVRPEVIENTDKMVVVKVSFSIPAYGIHYECYGGNDNADRGDAYKGATTDALTKIGSWLGIGADVFKGLHGKTPQPTASTRKAVTSADLDDLKKCNALLEWAYGRYQKAEDKVSFSACETLAKSYDVNDRVKKRFTNLFADYLRMKLPK